MNGLEQFEQLRLRLMEKVYHQNQSLPMACRYALEGEGKRVRPQFMLLTNQAYQGQTKNVLRGALAVEMIHTYSLVHDDLPAMDDDDFRRGRPSVHKAFNEQEGLLCGDALLTDSFSILAGTYDQELQLQDDLEPTTILQMISILARNSGGQGMVMGQSLDLHWTGRTGQTKEQLEQIHLRKTGCLFGASLAIGALSAYAPQKEIHKLQKIGEALGHIFQMCDDLLDDTNSKKIGKTQGKDAKQDKLTYLKFYDAPKLTSLIHSYTEETMEQIKQLSCDSQSLMDFSYKLAARTS